MARERQEVNNLFAYGTLMIEDVFNKFSKHPIQKSNGYLIGYECRQLNNRIYPGIIIGQGIVNGIIYHQLTQEDFLNLDAYEGEEYSREKVLINKSATEQISAWCYLYKKEFFNNLLIDRWSLDWYFDKK